MDIRTTPAAQGDQDLQRLLGEAFDRSPIPTVITRMTDGTYLAVNDAFCRLSGYAREEVIGFPSTEITTWRDPAARARMVEGLRDAGVVSNVQSEFIMKDGSVRSGILSAVTASWNGEPAILAFARDVTEEEERERRDRQAAEWLRGIFETAFDGVAIHVDGVILEANDALAQMFGYAVGEDLVGMHTVNDLCAPEYRDALVATIRANSQEPYVAQGIRKDGSRLTAELAGRPIEYLGKAARVVFVKDLTDLLAAQDAVHEANVRYRTVVENVPAVTYIWDSAYVEGQLPADFVSPQIEHLLGFTVGEWRSDPRLWHRMVHPDDLDRVVDQWNDAIQTGEPFLAEYRITTKSGEERWIRDEAHQFRYDDAGNPRWQGVMYDITEAALRRMELMERDARLAESEERFRTLVEEIPAITFVEEWVDPNDPDAGSDGNPLRYVSPQFEKITGISIEDRLADPGMWRTHLHPDDRDRVLALDEASSANATPLIADYRMVFPGTRNLWLHEETRLVRDADGSPLFWLGVQLDITDRMQAQERLTALNEIGNAMIAAASPRAVAQDALERLRVAVRATRASVIEVSLDDGQAIPLAIASATQIDLSTIRIEVDSIMDIDRLKRGESRVFDDLRGIDGLPPKLLLAAQHGTRSMATIPLMDQATLIGLLNLESDEPAAFTDEDLELAQEIAGPLALALQQAHLRETVEATASELERRLEDLRRTDAQRRSLLDQLVTAQEEERRKIASDIHDDSIQKLAAIGLRLQTLRGRLEDDEASLAILDRVDETVQNSVSRLRNLMFELWPPALDRHGLGAAIRAELEQTKAAGGMDYEIEDEQEVDLAIEIRTIGYRIAQEAIRNIRKHAGATTIRVHLADRDGGLFLRISDDGKGFSGDPTSPPGHLGVSGMHERATMAGGWLTIGPRKDGGTTVECWLPA